MAYLTEDRKKSPLKWKIVLGVLLFVGTPAYLTTAISKSHQKDYAQHIENIQVINSIIDSDRDLFTTYENMINSYNSIKKSNINIGIKFKNNPKLKDKEIFVAKLENYIMQHTLPAQFAKPDINNPKIAEDQLYVETPNAIYGANKTFTDAIEHKKIIDQEYSEMRDKNYYVGGILLDKIKCKIIGKLPIRNKTVSFDPAKENMFYDALKKKIPNNLYQGLVKLIFNNENNKAYAKS